MKHGHYNLTPESRARKAELFRKMREDPAFMDALNAARHSQKWRDSHAAAMRKLHGDPERNPLAVLSAHQRKIYNRLKRKGCDRPSALAVALKEPLNGDEDNGMACNKIP